MIRFCSRAGQRLVMTPEFAACPRQVGTNPRFFLVWNSDAAGTPQVAHKVVAEAYMPQQSSEQRLACVAHNGGARGVTKANQFVPPG